MDSSVQGSRATLWPVGAQGALQGLGRSPRAKVGLFVPGKKLSQGPIYIMQIAILCVLVKSVTRKLSFQPPPLQAPFYVIVFEILVFNFEVFQTLLKKYRTIMSLNR